MTALAERTAFITGGGNGIGLAFARALIERGCRVAVADVRADAARAAADSLGDKAIGIPLDVRSRADFARVADEVEERLGPVSILVNSAGVNLFLPVDESSYDDWDWVLGVNLNGVINAVTTFVPRMKAHARGGHVINVSSMASYLIGANAGAYNTSKAAVTGLSESLYYSLAPHDIGVSLVLPGLVNSNIHASDDVRPAELPRRGKPADAALRARFAAVHEAGMDPAEVATKALAAVEENRFYVFTHPELKEELHERLDIVKAAFPDGDAPRERADFENQRRARFAAAREAALRRQ
ncbi:MAG TPA: SDR family NAD(P)-dependent oxidoreductase [Kofleriaceae bacterium]|jgi:NAD(P)-dependent dehydrogenase (short-subunit alcohol dehydrogenase family)